MINMSDCFSQPATPREKKGEEKISSPPVRFDYKPSARAWNGANRRAQFKDKWQMKNARGSYQSTAQNKEIGGGGIVNSWWRPPCSEHFKLITEEKEQINYPWRIHDDFLWKLNFNRYKNIRKKDQRVETGLSVRVSCEQIQFNSTVIKYTIDDVVQFILVARQRRPAYIYQVIRRRRFDTVSQWIWMTEKVLEEFFFFLIFPSNRDGVIFLNICPASEMYGTDWNGQRITMMTDSCDPTFFFPAIVPNDTVSKLCFSFFLFLKNSIVSPPPF